MKKSSALLAFLTVAASSSLLAGTGTWTNLTSGELWSAGSNWSGATVADGAGFRANFNTLNIAVDNTVNLD